MPEPQWLSVTTADSRTLEVVDAGPSDGFPLVYHSGTPSAAVPFNHLWRAAAAAGLRTVWFSRPGYGESTERPGRTVADVVTDVSAVLAALGLDSFVTLGWSGGGPHALACAALMPEACRAAATLAGVAPFDADGIAWLDGMGEENVDEFGAAVLGADELTTYLTAAGRELANVTADQIAAAMGDVVSDVDKSALTGDLADHVAHGFRRAVVHGVSGWRDDDLAFVRRWGFELESITVPVAIWQGGQDRMVPFGHGQWLAGHIPGAQAHLYDDEGHVSLVAQVGRILADLAHLADLPSQSRL